MIEKIGRANFREKRNNGPNNNRPTPSDGWVGEPGSLCELCISGDRGTSTKTNINKQHMSTNSTRQPITRWSALRPTGTYPSQPGYPGRVANSDIREGLGPRVPTSYT